MLPQESLAHLKSTFHVLPMGEPVGNLTIGRGRVDDRTAHVAIVENRIASGALGVRECDKLASLFKIVAAQKSPLILYLDSAGAKVSEGLPALGAFRNMYRQALSMAASGAPVAAFCGTNCFGGASMLASLAGLRVYASNTRLAMSGPAILAQTAGVSVLDETFAAMSHAAIGSEARVRLGAGNVSASASLRVSDHWLRDTAEDRHRALGERLAQIDKPAKVSAAEPLYRKDLGRLYPAGYALLEQRGIAEGTASVDGKTVTLFGLVDGKPLGAVRAWRLADRLRSLLVTPPAMLHVLVDCEAHIASLEDERIMLSAYIANLAGALHALAAAGTHIETTVLGRLGGGVYVALAAPSAQLNMVYGSEIQLLPGRAIESILGQDLAQKHEIADYQKAKVAEREIKLGLVEDMS
jgi:hypothetical protein